MQNLSDNLLRDFEDKWWKICREVGLRLAPRSLSMVQSCISLLLLQLSRHMALEQLTQNLESSFQPFLHKAQGCVQGDEEAMSQMLDRSRDVLPHCVDSNERR